MINLRLTKNYQTPPSSPFLELQSITGFDEEDSIQSTSGFLSTSNLEGFMFRPFNLNQDNNQLLSPLSPNGKEQTDFFTTLPEHQHNKIDDLKFLAVDDNQINLTIITKILNKTFPASCSQLTATMNPLEVVTLAETNNYDVLFLDIEMPELSGVEIAKRLRAIPKLESLCIIAVTSCASAEDLAVYSNAGIDYTIPKPIVLDAEQFQMTVLETMKKRRDATIYKDI